MDGFINLYKPEGISSQRAITLCKKTLQIKKAGHSGTLDPAAAGILPVAVGKATRLTEYVMDLPKRYLAEITFGKTTDTQDREGKILTETDCTNIKEDDLRAVIPQFIGQIEQVPPMASAIKVQGQPLYKLQRKGQIVERPARQITIYQLQIVSMDWQKSNPKAVLDICCSRGTYIRTLCHDIGAILGVGAYMSALERCAVGFFKKENAITLENLADMVQKEDFSFFIPMEQVIAHLPQILVTEKQKIDLMYGRKVCFLPEKLELQKASCILTPEGKLLGIGHLTQNEEHYILQMDKVFLTPPVKEGSCEI